MQRAMHKQCETHMPDAMHERTNELTYAEGGCERDQPAVRNAHAHTTQVYLVEWPEHGIVKVGCSRDGRRWRSFLRRGGTLRHLIETDEDRAYQIEFEMHLHMAVRYERPFSTAADAVPLLGGIGRGFTECFRVPPQGSDDLYAQLVRIDQLAEARRRRGA